VSVTSESLMGGQPTGRPSGQAALARVMTVMRGDRVGLSAAVILAVVYLSVSTPYFFSLDNGRNISTAISYTGICAAISTLVLAGGGVDLSVAAVMAISGTTAAGLLDAGYPTYIAIIAALAMGAIAGVLNAILITSVGINPLIATIGTQFVLRGFAYIVINSRELLIKDKSFLYFGQGKILGAPVPSLIMFASFIVVGIAMKMTVFGQHIYAIGGSPDGNMARLSGVPVKRRQYQMYIASGTISALAGIVLASYSGSATGNAALGLELPIIAAVILGGTALGGGRGTVVGTVLGVVLLGIINNGLTLRSVPYVWLFVVQGCALLLAVVIDERRQRSEAR
jgi:ribose/xylose/arabinose/galactoside ABC-type transport system permease subunit